MANRPFTFMTTPAVRDAVRGDAATLAGLMSELGYPVTPEVFWARLEKMAGPRSRTLVAQVDDRVAGFVGCSIVSLYETDTPICWIMALAVTVPFRRHGVGRFLISAAESWCRGQGISEMRIHSGDARRDAHAFYEACGFARTGVRFRKSVN